VLNLKLKYIFKGFTVPKIEKDRSKTSFNQDWSKNRSRLKKTSLWMILDIYRPVSVSVLPKIGKRPDWTGLSSTKGVVQGVSFNDNRPVWDPVSKDGSRGKGFLQ